LKAGLVIMTNLETRETDEVDLWVLVGAVLEKAIKEARAGDDDAIEFLATCAPDMVWENLNLSDELPTKPIRKR
jgi:hypothetical protein